MPTEPGREWVGTPLDADRIDPRAIVEITVEFDEGKGGAGQLGDKGGWSHGVRVRRRDRGGPGERGASQVLIRRICLRYEDGRRVCFVPEAGEEFFSKDDAHRVLGMLHGGSEALEWGPTLEGEPGTDRFPGAGPYDTGAV